MAQNQTIQSGLSAWATYVMYKLAYRLARLTPYWLGIPVVYAASAFAFAFSGKRRRQVQRNLKRIYRHEPLSRQDLRRKCRQTFVSYGRYWFESFNYHQQSLLSSFQPIGIRHLEQATQSGRGVVIALAHMGNWDLGGAWITQLGYQLTVVMETPDSPQMQRLFEQQRQRLGFEVVSTTDKALPFKLMGAINQGHLVCLVCDRDVTGGGIPVSFFGETTNLPVGPAYFALRCQVPIVPVGIYRCQKRQFRVEFHAPICPPKGRKLRQNLPKLTQRVTNQLEQIISQSPEQWLVMWPNWPSDKDDGPGG